MDNYYQSLIFTNHGLERLASRSITQSMVWQVVSHPDKQFNEANNKVKFVGMLGNRRLHVVAQRLEKEKKWLVISAWVRGEDDKAPLAWRVISFPFWLVWKFLLWLVSFLFSKNQK